MVLSNLASYLGSLVRHFLPWSALALGAVVLSRERVRKWARERRAPLLFAASWYLVLLCVFSAANIQRGRYLVPAYPLVAAACASLLVFVFDAGRRSAVARALALALALLASVVAVALVAIGWRTEESSFSGWAACACALGGLVLVLRAPRERAVLAAAGLLLVVIPLGERGSREIFDASAAPALIARLEALGARGADVACVGGEAALASQLRLQTGGRLDPSWTREPHVPLPPQARFVIVAPEIEAPELAVSAREDCGFEYRRLGSAEIARVALARDARGARRSPPAVPAAAARRASAASSPSGRRALISSRARARRSCSRCTCTEINATSGGRTPAMRAAWPSVRGRRRASLSRFVRQARDGREIELTRDLDGFVALHALDVGFLARDVARVLDVDLERLGDLGRELERRQFRVRGDELRGAHLPDAAAPRRACGGRGAGCAGARAARARAFVARALESRERIRGHQTRRSARGTSRCSALSLRKSSRCSARLVNIRYGSDGFETIRSSTMTPM